MGRGRRLANGTSSDISRITMPSEQSCDGEVSQPPSPPPKPPPSYPPVSGGGTPGGASPGSGSKMFGSGGGQSSGIAATGSQRGLPLKGPVPSGNSEQMVYPLSPE